ncbi:MAG: S41 family peptidase [Candidatus Pacebacteria bacterium]|jgi:carboxyl-terminal processing protease|nr:S41 family peptidase [Candidatus Paceibacterota bacterium]MBT4652718.1 S41 family peptidase [Candidatus Paceibacterota bacterium]MBT6755875.1 S41 family peptidase [Candidatus Paceibacterota bacterium]MBT6921088.1 S41 family peptidase [Candidatus Paceibacterota bacterium]
MKSITPSLQNKSFKNIKKIKVFTLQNILNFVVAVLLVWVGAFIGFGYSQTGELPFNLEKSSFISNSITQKRVNQSDRLVGDPKSENNKVDFNSFWEVWGYLEKDYLEPEKLDAGKMVHGAIAGMTASLGDPYTAYLPPDDNLRSGEDLAGSFYGVGIELGYIDGTLAVIAPLDDSPAERAGAQAGDLIIHVRDDKKEFDEDTTGWSLDKAVNKIRGGKGEPVFLTLFRPDDKEKGSFEIEIIRDEIIVKSVKMEFVEHAGKKVAHIKLSRFGERTADEWDDIVTEILAERSSLSGVVLDMRNNPGGFFNTSITIASEFFKKGIVVSQKGKVQTQDFRARGKARLVGMPVVVLVNKGSASASEIVAGALKDNIGAKLVGEQTFGKGTVQDRRELSNGGGVHITIGRWLMPEGEWIHDEGIPVDVEVKGDYETEEDEVLLKGIEEL